MRMQNSIGGIGKSFGVSESDSRDENKNQQSTQEHSFKKKRRRKNAFDIHIFEIDFEGLLSNGEIMIFSVADVTNNSYLKSKTYKCLKTYRFMIFDN